jgi:hypothetical protein
MVTGLAHGKHYMTPRPGYGQRIATGVLLPALVGALCWEGAVIVNTVRAAPQLLGPLHILRGFISIWIAAFIFTFLQSVIYTLLMEHVINRYMTSDSCVVLSSGLLGVGAGCAVPEPVRNWEVMATIGLTVGAIVGFVLRRMYKKAGNLMLQPTTEAPR